jgi:hypothetical protein
MDGECDVRIEKIWAMPNKWTFTILPIKNLLQEEMDNGAWLDPFCGKFSPVPYEHGGSKNDTLCTVEIKQ